MIDPKDMKKAESTGAKEGFMIMIDSIRKSLGIEKMEDIELLVKVFYEYGPKKKEKLAEEERSR